MNNLDSLSGVYPFDPQTQTYTIPVRLGWYNDFFNPMDPTPAPARDLSFELVEYLNQCSDEIPSKYPLAISLEIQKEAFDLRREKECLESLRNYYQHNIFISHVHIRRKRIQVLKYLLVSFICLAAYTYSEQWSQVYFFLNLLREAVLIGGWIFMWQAVTLNFFELDTQHQEINRYRRLIAAKVNFHYVRALEGQPEIKPIQI